MGLYERSYMRSGGDAGADSKAMIKKLIIANVIVFLRQNLLRSWGLP